MLTELWVRNLAVIEDLSARFGSGLNALTGETGAGKSLIVGALDLVLGARGSADLLRKGAAEAEIVVRFDLEAKGRGAIAGEAPGEDGELVLRRVITADGRSRAYVNDRPVTVGRLRELGTLLADLHGQHEQQSLLREETHLEFLDAFAEAEAEREAVTVAYAAAVEARDVLEAFLVRSRQGATERDFLRFQVEELEAAELVPGEKETLEQERRRAAQSGRLAEAVGIAAASLVDGDPGAGELLGEASRRLAQAVAWDPDLEPLRRQLDEALVTAEEVGRELTAYLEDLGADPERLEEVETRLELLTRLSRKYHEDVDGMIRLRDRLREELDAEEDAPARQAELEARAAAAEAVLATAAGALSTRRSRAAASLGREVTRELKGLGMADARFRVELEAPRSGVTPAGRRDPIGPRGAEEARFVLAANAGESGGPLSRIASGGEASRVMLALKNVLRRVDPVPLVIFDEVDAGIGGLVAEAVAARLAAIAGERQVLVVTHLAVIAGRADHHLRVAKSTVRGRTRIGITAVDGEEREAELARMLAGSAGGEDARRTARTILSGGRTP